MKPKAAGKGKGKTILKGASKGSAEEAKGKNPKGKPKKGAKKDKPVTTTKKKEDDTAEDKA